MLHHGFGLGAKKLLRGLISILDPPLHINRHIRNQGLGEESIFVDDSGICPKLDEIAKDRNVESGIEDSDEEPSPKKRMKKI